MLHIRFSFPISFIAQINKRAATRRPPHFLCAIAHWAGLRRGHSAEADGHPIRAGRVAVAGIPVVAHNARVRSVARVRRGEPPDAAAAAGASALSSCLIGIGEDRVLHVLGLSVAFGRPLDRLEYFRFERYPELSEVLPCPRVIVGKGLAGLITGGR